METRNLTLEDLRECIQTVLSGGRVELFIPEKEGGDVFRRVDLQDYMETMFRGAVPVIYARYVPRVNFTPQKQPEKKEEKQSEKKEGKEPAKLSKKQEEPIDRGKILALTKAGWPIKEIAMEMGITQQEVKRQQEGA